MELDEIMEDILLKLLIHKVENDDRWVGMDVLKLKIGYGSDEVEAAIHSLQEEGLVEMNEETLRITKEGIECIVERV